MNKTEDIKINLINQLEATLVHRVLAHSYLFYFLMFIFGIILDLFLPIRIFNSIIIYPFGFLFLFLSSFLVFWAQHTSRKLDSNEKITKESFYKGPYRYTRMPTHYGLLLLFFGFGLLMNAFFLILFTLISFIVTKFVFLKKQEKVLENKYGEPYREYKKIVTF